MKPFPTYLIIFFCLNFIPPAHCQKVDLDTYGWAKKLADPTYHSLDKPYELDKILLDRDSFTTFNFLNKILTESSAKGSYFLARYNCLKAMSLRIHNPSKPAWTSNFDQGIKKEIISLLNEAIRQAYITDDDFLIASVSGYYGSIMNFFQNTEKAVMYMMYSTELYESVQFKGMYTTYFVLGELLWRIREYKKSIKYTKRGMSSLPSDYEDKDRYNMMSNNTIGLAFHRMELYDSAIYYYHKGLKLASVSNDSITRKIWTGIILGNLAQIDFVLKKFSTALPAFEMDYENNKKFEGYDEAANSLQWAAKTNLALGNKDLALHQIRESFQLLKKKPFIRYLQNTYQTAADIFKSEKNEDSADYYTDMYTFLHDSLERVIYLSGLEISQLRLNNEKSRYHIQNLEHKKDGQIQERNFIIAGVMLINVIIFLLINRQRLRSKYKKEVERTERLRLQSEVESAKIQMEMFTLRFIKNTRIIEELQSQIKTRQEAQQQQKLIADLTSQTILTEDDWARFKLAFDTIYPGLFIKIVSRFEHITQAELRMGALVLLHLTTREISTVLGISPNSVNKTKQRLRQRIGLDNIQELEKFIFSL